MINQLKETVSGAIIARAKYNAEGKRVEKEVNGVKTRFLYEGDKITLELTDTGVELARNIYGSTLIQRKMSGQVLNYFYNGHADVTALIDDAGAIAASYYYDAFGNIVEETGTAQNPYRYAGYEYDKETKNYYLQSRYYNPKIARFLSEDTYRGDRKDPLSLNLYTYCHNEPVMYVDPIGQADLLNHYQVGLDALKSLGIKLDSNTQDAFLAGLIYPDLLGLKDIASQSGNIKSYLEVKKAVGGKIDDIKKGLDEQLQKIPGYNIIKKASEVISIPGDTIAYWWNEQSIVGPMLADNKKTKDILLIQSHYWDKSYLHAMGKTEQTAEKVRDDITKETQKRIDRYKELIKKGKNDEAYFELGQALHYLTDSWTPSHAVRDGKTGEIEMFQDYNKQDLNKHKESDNLYDTSPELYKKVVTVCTNMIKDTNKGTLDLSKYYKMKQGAKVDVSKDMKVKKNLQILKDKWKAVWGN
jgi:RHS repeat-associated protein